MDTMFESMQPIAVKSRERNSLKPVPSDLAAA